MNDNTYLKITTHIINKALEQDDSKISAMEIARITIENGGNLNEVFANTWDTHKMLIQDQADMHDIGFDAVDLP